MSRIKIVREPTAVSSKARIIYTSCEIEEEKPYEISIKIVGDDLICRAENVVVGRLCLKIQDCDESNFSFKVEEALRTFFLNLQDTHQLLEDFDTNFLMASALIALFSENPLEIHTQENSFIDDEPEVIHAGGPCNVRFFTYDYDKGVPTREEFYDVNSFPEDDEQSVAGYLSLLRRFQ